VPFLSLLKRWLIISPRKGYHQYLFLDFTSTVLINNIVRYFFFLIIHFLLGAFGFSAAYHPHSLQYPSSLPTAVPFFFCVIINYYPQDTFQHLTIVFPSSQEYSCSDDYSSLSLIVGGVHIIILYSSSSCGPTRPHPLPLAAY